MTDIDVLVVGAGPTGLMAASELARQGLRVRVVDQAAAPSEHSKAMGVHARSLEILAELNLAEALIARGVKLGGVTVFAGGETVVSADLGELPTRYPFVLSVAQADTEAVLREHLASFDLEVERELRLVSFRQDGTGVTSTLVGPDGAEESVRSAWLVGCDGAHSVVRKRLEIPFEGSTYDERFLLADVKIDANLRDDRVTTFFGETGVLACFPMREGRFRLIGTSPPHLGAKPEESGAESATTRQEEAPSLDEIAALFRNRSGLPGSVSDPAWLARFRVHCRQVRRYRDDRVFLVGDAAHIHSPVGGQGLNTGLQDAHNLAWKLALVHRGEARGLLLDTYHEERHAIGRALLAGTDAATKVLSLKSSVARAVRDEVARFMASFELVQRRIAESAAELSVSYGQSSIVGEDTTSLLQGRIGSASSGETPTIGSIRRFDAGPKPGTRAPDAQTFVTGAESGTRRLLSVADTRKHTLLLFDGRGASKEGYERFEAIAQRLEERFPSLVHVLIVTPRAERPAEIAESRHVVLDTAGELEELYGALTECAYLLRPDLYIAYRSQPVDEAKLVAFLKTYLR